MFLIIGLGNPGKKYENTRHNAGFKAVDEIAANFQFPMFNFQSIFNAQISKGQINGKEIILAKPQTFMNNSGQTVKILNTKYKIQDTDLLVIHDDLDLPLGQMKIVKDRGSAGHKGVDSIIKSLGSKNFVRFRIGIASEKMKTDNPEKFVLAKFSKEENKIFKEVLQKTASAIEMYLKEGIEKTMSEYNKSF